MQLFDCKYMRNHLIAQIYFTQRRSAVTFNAFSLRRRVVA